jgi:hypothetical protein
MPITTTYLGYEMLILPPDLGADASSGVKNVDLDSFTIDTGSHSQTSRPAAPNEQWSISFLCETRDAWAELEDFLRTKAGRAYPFWLPHWNDDLIVLATDFFYVVVNDIGYTENLSMHPAYQRFLVIDMQDPTNLWGRAVSGSVDNGDGTETIDCLLDFPYPLTYNRTSAEGWRFSFVSLVRLDSDDLEIEYLSGEIVQITVPVFHVPEG